MAERPDLWQLESDLHAQGYGTLCGVDEAGAGPLAGRVYAAAVILPQGWDHPYLNDSKRVTPRRRDLLYEAITQEALAWSVAWAEPEEIDFAVQYLGLNEREGFNRGVLRGGMTSPASLFVAQMQDWLELGEGSRINTPGTGRDNWQWRLLPGELTVKLIGNIREMTRIYGRLPVKQSKT